MAERCAIRIGALAAAMRAGDGSLDPAKVAQLSDQAARVLDPDDALRVAIEDFARGFAAHRRDPAAVGQLGADLHRALELDTYTAPDLHRRDIHG